MNSISDHASLQNLIDQQEWWFSASEAHGLLSALIACGHAEAAAAVLGESALQAPGFPAFCQKIDETLAGEELAYQLFLPEDGDNAQRAQALVEWVQGFLLAIAYCQRHYALALDEQSQEYLNDLKAISHLDTAIDNSAESESELLDLEEHCRMGVLMLYAASRSVPPDAEKH